MRLLANENFPALAVRALREAGHDVSWVTEISPGLTDADVLARANHDNRFVITFDKDFGELAFRAMSPTVPGIILFRLSMHTPQHVAEVACRVLASRDDWAGNFSVIEDSRLRMTPLQSRLS